MDDTVSESDEQLDGETGSFTDQYSLLTWIGSAIISLLTFPFGILVPVYFIFKARDGSGATQGRWEVWAVLLSNVIGMLVVELAGETGAKILVILNVLAFIGVIVAAVVGAFVLGLGGSAQQVAFSSATFVV